MRHHSPLPRKTPTPPPPDVMVVDAHEDTHTLAPLGAVAPFSQIPPVTRLAPPRRSASPVDASASLAEAPPQNTLEIHHED